MESARLYGSRTFLSSIHQVNIIDELVNVRTNKYKLYCEPFCVEDSEPPVLQLVAQRTAHSFCDLEKNLPELVTWCGFS